MLEFQNVTFRYANEQEPIIDALSFSVKQGQFISFIGTSGCGKSTLFRLMNGMETPQSGQIVIDFDNKDRKSISKSAYMPQKDLLFPWRTIEKNVCLPMELAGIEKKEQKRRAEEILEEVGLSKWAKRYPRELSGGMRQRASFARTLLTGSELLLLDEPFSALDALTKIDMQEWLQQEWLRHGRTILFITHDVEEAVFLSQKIYCITKTPITHLEEAKIPLAYPRDRKALSAPEIQDLKEKLIASVRQKVKL